VGYQRRERIALTDLMDGFAVATEISRMFGRFASFFGMAPREHDESGAVSRTMRRILAILTFALLASPSRSSHAEQFDFTLVTQPQVVGAGNVDALYGVDGAVLMTSVQKANPSGVAGAGGSNGVKGYQGVNHKLAAYVGATPWLMFGLEQSISTTNTSADGVTLGVLVPEVRFKVLRFDSAPVAISVFTAPRVRLSARRSSTVTAGTGLEIGQYAVRFATNVAFETSTSSEQRENGFRYNAGLAFPLVGILRGAVEAWGQMTWPELGTRQQAHHIGPTLKIRMNQAWIAANVNTGLKDQPNKVFYEWGAAVQIGMAW